MIAPQSHAGPRLLGALAIGIALLFQAALAQPQVSPFNGPAFPPDLLVPLTNSTNSTDPCAASFEEKDYDLKLHIAAVFIVLGTSAGGILSAVFIASHKSLSQRQCVLFSIQFLKFVGIGVILATAWIHLLPPAFQAFSNPCLLSHGVLNAYNAGYVGLFGMIATFMVQGLEFCALTRGDIKARQNAAKRKADTTKAAKVDDHHDEHSGKVGLKVDESDEPCNVPHTHSHDHEEKPHKPKKPHDVSLHDVSGHSHDVMAGIVDEHSAEDEASDIATIFLEMGIIFHSAIIGLDLGIATNEFKTLLVAIIFHQLFEGIALGVRIAEIKRFTSIKKFGAALLYPLVTPIGIAIGIGVRHSFNDNDWREILTQGIFDSLSAGILFYNAYVELMAFEMNRNAVFRAHNGKRKAALFFAVYLGASIMAIIGIWA